MLPKINRADKKAIEQIFKEGRFLNSPSLTFKFIRTSSPSLPRISFIAPKSVAKLAVKRNSLRRKGYAVLVRYVGEIPRGLIGVFIFRKYQDDSSILQNEIKNLLGKIN